jgi:hypothetical protein
MAVLVHATNHMKEKTHNLEERLALVEQHVENLRNATTPRLDAQAMAIQYLAGGTTPETQAELESLGFPALKPPKDTVRRLNRSLFQGSSESELS